MDRTWALMTSVRDLKDVANEQARDMGWSTENDGTSAVLHITVAIDQEDVENIDLMQQFFAAADPS